MIPQLEQDIPKLQKHLADEEKVLEEIKENAKGCSILELCSLKLQLGIYF